MKQVFILFVLMFLSSCASTDSKSSVENMACRPSTGTSAVSPNLIRDVLRDNVSDFKMCYQEYLDKDSSEKFKGEIKLQFTINSYGHVTTSKIESAQPLSTAVTTCMQYALVKLQFPCLQEGKTVEVNQPLILYPRKI